MLKNVGFEDNCKYADDGVYKYLIVYENNKVVRCSVMELRSCCHLRQSEITKDMWDKLNELNKTKVRRPDKELSKEMGRLFLPH